MFQPVYRYFKTVACTNKVTVRKSEELSDEIIKALLHLVIVLLQHLLTLNYE